MGLHPFVFHIDAGWNLPVAEENIKRLTDKLGVKLHIKKMDWNEMKEMQLAWFRTGLEMLDAPQTQEGSVLYIPYSAHIRRWNQTQYLHPWYPSHNRCIFDKIFEILA